MWNGEIAVVTSGNQSSQVWFVFRSEAALEQTDEKEKHRSIGIKRLTLPALVKIR